MDEKYSSTNGSGSSGNSENEDARTKIDDKNMQRLVYRNVIIAAITIFLLYFDLLKFLVWVGAAEDEQSAQGFITLLAALASIGAGIGSKRIRNILTKLWHRNDSSELRIAFYDLINNGRELFAAVSIVVILLLIATFFFIGKPMSIPDIQATGTVVANITATTVALNTQQVEETATRAIEILATRAANETIAAIVIATQLQGITETKLAVDAATNAVIHATQTEVAFIDQVNQFLTQEAQRIAETATAAQSVVLSAYAGQAQTAAALAATTTLLTQLPTITPVPNTPTLEPTMPPTLILIPSVTPTPTQDSAILQITQVFQTQIANKVEIRLADDIIVWVDIDAIPSALPHETAQRQCEGQGERLPTRQELMALVQQTRATLLEWEWTIDADETNPAYVYVARADAQAPDNQKTVGRGELGIPPPIVVGFRCVYVPQA